MRNISDNRIRSRSKGDLCPPAGRLYRELTRPATRRRVVQGHGSHQGPAASCSRKRIRNGIGTFQRKTKRTRIHRADGRHQLPEDCDLWLRPPTPRAFNFDGEYQCRQPAGVIEFIEVLKLEVAFLYDLPRRQQEQQDQAEEIPQPISTKSSSAITNGTRYRKLQNTSSWSPA